MVASISSLEKRIGPTDSTEGLFSRLENEIPVNVLNYRRKDNGAILTYLLNYSNKNYVVTLEFDNSEKVPKRAVCYQLNGDLIANEWSDPADLEFSYDKRIDFNNEFELLSAYFYLVPHSPRGNGGKGFDFYSFYINRNIESFLSCLFAEAPDNKGKEVISPTY